MFELPSARHLDYVNIYWKVGLKWRHYSINFFSLNVATSRKFINCNEDLYLPPHKNMYVDLWNLFLELGNSLVKPALAFHLFVIANVCRLALTERDQVDKYSSFILRCVVFIRFLTIFLGFQLSNHLRSWIYGHL